MQRITNGGAADEKVRAALARGGVVDITTTGRKSGRPRRIEIVFHNIDGRIYISGIPSTRRRAWLRNLEARPELTLHLKGQVKADLAAKARIIEDEAERRLLLAPIARNWRRNDVETMVRQSPLIEVILDQKQEAA
ncbi:MAG TPA: nitroreductase family deazaflavin-dependent oxidoreductase [Candidatus Dormibacteraeota bacterium]|jgi:deazaflavin-dependent oxidoreductase (nitroreductase family)|nr:nitroreductase family deazaflavin-dependent oxidoreductase [Candidatus Dormibacteraeota bacterium]